MANLNLLSRFGLIFMLWNCRSIIANYIEFSNYVHKVNPHFICLSETYLKLTDNFTVRNYKIFRKDRFGRGGGIAILVRNDIKSHLKQNFRTFDYGNLEALTIQIQINSMWCV